MSLIITILVIIILAAIIIVGGYTNNVKEAQVAKMLNEFDEVIYINCAAVVHTEHFYNVYSTYETNVPKYRLYFHCDSKNCPKIRFKFYIVKFFFFI